MYLASPRTTPRSTNVVNIRFISRRVRPGRKFRDTACTTCVRHPVCAHKIPSRTSGTLYIILWSVYCRSIFAAQAVTVFYTSNARDVDDDVVSRFSKSNTNSSRFHFLSIASPEEYFTTNTAVGLYTAANRYYRRLLPTIISMLLHILPIHRRNKMNWA